VLLDANPWAMHHKVLIIDDRTVATGSFNFSRNAAQTNDENVLVLAGNRETARLYTEEFERVAHTTLPQAAAPPTTPSTARLLPINTATQAELELLPGIGPTIARRIIAGRPYRNAQDLERVRGLGARKIQEIQGQISFK
jgi:DNA uptake protein ComE-like DNA-binding protein